jgi:hypothetical protein
VNASISPVFTVDGRIYYAGAGKSIVLKAASRFEAVATNELGDDGPASPAVANGCIYIKGNEYLYCLGKRGTSRN